MMQSCVLVSLVNNHSLCFRQVFYRQALAENRRVHHHRNFILIGVGGEKRNLFPDEALAYAVRIPTAESNPA